MVSSLAIVVYSCLATTNFNDFDPHQLNAAQVYVTKHPDHCQQEPPLMVEGDLSFEQCTQRAMLGYMPGWMQGHPDRVWLGARCIEAGGGDTGGSTKANSGTAP